MQHADAIKAAADKSDELVKKVDGAVQEVHSQGQKAQAQLETLKALIEGQRKPEGNVRQQIPTYANKEAAHGHQKVHHQNNNNCTPKATHDQAPPPYQPAEPHKSTLRRRGLDDRRIIDHHVDGLVLLYFAREMEGSIVETRTKIHEQVGMSHLVKSINFLGDHDNNLTEIFILGKYARWLPVQLDKIKQQDKILGEHYPECNPFEPRWDDIQLMSTEIKTRRNPRHIKKILDQWYACAKRSQSESIRNFYTLLLKRVTAEPGRHLWKHMVHNIQVDPSFDTFPKVFHTPEEEQKTAKTRVQKRRADGKHGPAAHTPISVARKRKGRKPNTETGNDDMSDESGSDTSQEDEVNRAGNNVGPIIGGKPQPSHSTEHAGLSINKATRNQASAPKTPARQSTDTNTKAKERESGTMTAGYKENVPP